jgi:hypothetical protein
LKGDQRRCSAQIELIWIVVKGQFMHVCGFPVFFPPRMSPGKWILILFTAAAVKFCEAFFAKYQISI